MVWLSKLFHKREDAATSEDAKERLRLVIVHDRSNVDTNLLANLKNELFEVLSKYTEIENEELDIRFTYLRGDDGNVPALLANIPIKKLKLE